MAAYTYYCNSTQPPIAPSTSAKMFELFLNGKSLDEIHKMNPGFSLGQIVASRVNEKWDLKLAEHRQRLLDNVRERVQQIQLESVEFLADMLAANNKLYGDKIKRFLMSGNPADLEGLELTMKGYKEVVESLMKLTGQDTKKVSVHNTVSVEAPVPKAASKVSPDEAAKILDAIEVKQVK